MYIQVLTPLNTELFLLNPPRSTLSIAKAPSKGFVSLNTLNSD